MNADGGSDRPPLFSHVPVRFIGGMPAGGGFSGREEWACD